MLYYKFEPNWVGDSSQLDRETDLQPRNNEDQTTAWITKGDPDQNNA